VIRSEQIIGDGRRHATAATWGAAAVMVAISVVRLAPLIASPHRHPTTSTVGTDFATTIWGPNVLVAEGANPWDIHNSVPRFGVFPSSPLWPSGYGFGRVFSAMGYPSALMIWLLVSLVVIVLAARMIALSFDVDARLAWLIGLGVLMSPVARYNLQLGQSGAGLMAITGFFATLHRRPPGWSGRAHLVGFGALALFLLPKPTFALAALATELAYRRRADWCAAAVALLALIGGLVMVVIMWRSHLAVGDVLASYRATARVLGAAPVNRIAGDRVDLLSLLAPSPVVDLLMIGACVVALVALSRWQKPTTFERLLIGSTVTTLFTYHHMYDTTVLLTLALVSVVLWRGMRAWIVMVALIASSWLYRLRAIERPISSLTGIDQFPLEARLVFVIGTGLLIDAVWRISSGSGRS
jgi:hypothetical protein